MIFGTLGAPCGRSPERAYICLELKGKRGASGSLVKEVS